MKKVNYRYERNSNTEKLNLVGIEVVTIENNHIERKGFYNGIALSLEDALNPENRLRLGIAFPESFKERYERFNAVGVIYFPTSNSFGYLEEHDEVIESNEEFEALKMSIQPEEVMVPSLRSYYDYMDPSDSLLELCNVPMTLTRTSTR